MNSLSRLTKEGEKKMAVKEESRVRCEEITYKQYTTSDGKVFLRQLLGY